MDKEFTFNEMMKTIKDFCDERDWEQYHNPKDLAIGIVTEASELLDIFRFKTDEQQMDIIRDEDRMQAVSDEIIDVLYFVMRFAQLYKIDIEKEFDRKMEKNNSRYPVETARGSNRKYTEVE